MTLLELRTQITAALSSAAVPLGTYTYPNGQTTPALWVDEGRPQPGLEVTGLEVVVYLNPNLKVTHTFKRTIVLRDWSCFLKNWSTTPGIVEAALNAISSQFKHATNIRLIQAGAEGVERASFSIPD